MLGTTQKLYAFCFVIVAILIQGQAWAQPAVPAHTSYFVGSWELSEVTDAQGDVMGLWGIPRVPVDVGNIRRLWFEALPNDDWNVWAFEPVAMTGMIDALLDAGADPDSVEFLYYKEYQAADNALSLDVDGGATGLVSKGFIDGDPLTESVAALSNPGPMIDLLANVGYPIAPGMSDLLVAGTSGSGVNMNPATKQLLNCLRSLSSSCGECVCVKTESDIQRGPWTVTESTVPDGRLKCVYSRVETHYYWTYGEHPYNCTDCSEGTADDPVSFDQTVEQVTYWLDVAHCPDAP